MEREVLSWWREARVFEESLRLREGAPRWVFYEGPPTANGKPGIHHVEARTFKDIYPRYKTMTGHLVDRKGGWDCHGLPVELQVEKEIGTRSKRDIEAFGIAEFNRLCRESVTRYVEDWERLTERIGFWLDMGAAYLTMDPAYVQSVWWALKRLHELGLLYQDDKVTAYCPRCGTALSDHEVAMGYRQVRDPSVFVKFPVVGSGGPEAEGASLVGWTTTPWTLISNLGLAVAPGELYVRLRIGSDELIVAQASREALEGAEQVGDPFPGSALVGARYSPPFENVTGDVHRVVGADFVSMDEGTGVVHMAPAFGAEDLEVGRREGWPVYRPVDDEGRFTDQAPELVRGQAVKAADGAIIEDLRRRGLVVRAEEIEHTYPLCWRCDTPLLYFARSAWYIRTTARKDDLLAANETVDWYPDHIKHGRFGDWLANNVDWSLSRERYWGTPLPVWACGEGHHTVIGSLEELSGLAGRDVTGIDPHRPDIDEVAITCPSCRSTARRVPEVIDAWFDSGAMPYAQWGYRGPGSGGEELFADRYPADFIAEGLDQTRGWFYSLMAEGVLLFDRPAYRNVVCLGLLVDREGRKMSKRLGNVLDAWQVVDRQGADALRWFLIASGSPWSDRRVFMEAIDDVVRRFLLTLWNTYAFFVTYANIDEPDIAAAPPPARRPPLDRWALSQLHGATIAVRDAMEAYDATGAARRLAQLVDDLSNWYVRRSRRRFWDPGTAGAGGGASEAKLSAYATLHECLVMVARLLAPFTPFISEAIYRNLATDEAGPPSVHLTDYPQSDPSLVDEALDEAMAVVRTVVSLGRTVRTDAKVKVRQPLSRAVVQAVRHPETLPDLLPLIAEELNVKEVAFAESTEELSDWAAKPNFRSLGPRIGSRVQELADALAADDGAVARALADEGNATVRLSTGDLVLERDDVELVQRTRAGWGVASDGGITVALDLEPDRDLRMEGTVRELVHHLQNLRKSAGLEVTDRIEVGIDSTGEVAAAVGGRRDYLAGEVLATSVLEGELDGADGSTDVTLDGQSVRLTLRRA